MNQLLQARKQRGWSQLQVIAQMTAAAKSAGVTLPAAQTMRVQLSGWENNRHQPSDLYRKLLTGVFELSQVELGFGAGAALAGGAPELLAGAFESGDNSADGDVRVLCRLNDGRVTYVTLSRRAFLAGTAATAGISAGAAAQTAAAARPTLALVTAGAYGPTPVEHLDRVRRLLVDNDNLLGPGQVIPAVHEHLGVIQSLRREASGADRQRLLELQTQFGEFASWLHQDAGDFTAAQGWLDRSLQWSHTLGDDDLTSYVLARKAQLAGEMREADDVIDLAQAAQRVTPHGGRLSGVAKTYEAWGHALAGNATAAERTFDEAHVVATDSGTAPDGWGTWLNAAYVDVHRAMGREALGQHDKAADGFAEAIEELPGGYHRDRGVYLARQAVAHVKAGRPEQAATIGAATVSFAEGTRSGRILASLANLDSALRPWSELDGVVAFREAFDRVLVHEA